MTRNEYIRMEYRKKRYMEHLTQAELDQRARDIFANLTVLTDEGKIGLPPLDKEGIYWLNIFTHLLEEFSIRKGFVSDGFLASAQIPNPTWPKLPRGLEALKGRQFKAGSHLFKFGKEKYLRPALEKGYIRLAPASSYADPSLNQAIRDDELSFTFSFPGKDFVIQLLDQKTLKPTGESFSAEGAAHITQNNPTDYLVYCFSEEYVIRAADDFEADCCLIINDIKSFINRLKDSVSIHIPNWSMCINVVDYLDPLNANPKETKAFFSKHFRYAYQKEVRAVWFPQKPLAQAQTIYATLGSLEDIGELIIMPPHQSGAV